MSIVVFIIGLWSFLFLMLLTVDKSPFLVNLGAVFRTVLESFLLEFCFFSSYFLACLTAYFAAIKLKLKF